MAWEKPGRGTWMMIMPDEENMRDWLVKELGCSKSQALEVVHHFNRDFLLPTMRNLYRVTTKFRWKDAEEKKAVLVLALCGLYEALTHMQITGEIKKYIFEWPFKRPNWLSIMAAKAIAFTSIGERKHGKPSDHVRSDRPEVAKENDRAPGTSHGTPPGSGTSGQRSLWQ